MNSGTALGPFASGNGLVVPGESLIINQLVIGDLNGDGVVDLLDVAPFVDAVLDGEFIAAADINGDGVVDLLDVAPFIDLIVG